jgi:toxin ParE1/3/4
MLPIIWHPAAEKDLLVIIEYVAERNPTAAFKLNDLLRDSVTLLAEHPYLFKASDRVKGCREIVVHPNYLILYKVLASSVLVIKVAHARQMFP